MKPAPDTLAGKIDRLRGLVRGEQGDPMSAMKLASVAPQIAVLSADIFREMFLAMRKLNDRIQELEIEVDDDEAE